MFNVELSCKVITTLSGELICKYATRRKKNFFTKKGRLENAVKTLLNLVRNSVRAVLFTIVLPTRYI